MTHAECAWLAGLLEGEGCFTFSGWVNNRRQRYAHVKLRMTDEDVVRRARDVAGVGEVYGPEVHAAPRQATWIWRVSSQQDALALMAAVYCWLGPRRQDRIDELVAEILPMLQHRKPRSSLSIEYPSC